VLNVILAGDTW